MIIVNIACSDLGSSEIVTKINADVMTGCVQWEVLNMVMKRTMSVITSRVIDKMIKLVTLSLLATQLGVK